MQSNTGLKMLPRHVVTGTGEQNVLDGVEVERGRLSAGVVCAGGVLNLAEGTVTAELSVSAVGSNASPDPHHWVALLAEVQGQCRRSLDG